MQVGLFFLALRTAVPDDDVLVVHQSHALHEVVTKFCPVRIGEAGTFLYRGADLKTQAVVLYVRKISEVRFHFLHHFRTRTPVKFMPGYLGGYCLPVYLFGEVILQCRHAM